MAPVSASAITIQARPPPGEAHVAKFLKKTARGKVVRVARERYVRDDVGCARKACKQCEGEAVLEAAGSSNKAVASRHYLILDTNVVLHQIDLLEGAPDMRDVVVPQTVLDEVRHRSLPLYSRLQALIGDAERRWAVFWNVVNRATAISREPGESPNDFNDRAIRRCVAWYRDHLRQTGGTKNLDAVLLSDDADNVSKAKASGLTALSVREYAAGMADAERLLDLLSARAMDEPASRALFPPHLAPHQLGKGTTHSGFFGISPHNTREALVRTDSYPEPILIVGRKAMNRAIEGDVVAVELLPKEEWRSEADELREEGEDGEDEDEEDGDVAKERKQDDTKPKKTSGSSSSAPLRPTGRIVAITRRNWRSYVCTLDISALPPASLSSLSAATLFATPVDPKIPRIRIRTRQAASLISQKILVGIDDWRETSRYPDGHLVRALGKAESKEAEQESLLLEHDVPYRPFSRVVLDCLPVEGDDWKVPPKGDGTSPEWRDRVDMRGESICSIDPPGCQDIDDALHAKTLPNGNIEAGVHIADVSYFVRPDTPMDTEAASRGTTVYLVDKRVDMLPHLLGTNLCSLRPHVERLAFSVVWELTPTADIVNVRFFKSVIASREAFTYEDAQRRKDDLSLNDDITLSVRALNKMAVQLKAKRMAAGALNLASPELRIQLDSSESTGPVDVEKKELFETNSLVEEFMLLANVSVAERIQAAFPVTAVLRRHAPPPAHNFETLNDLLRKRRGVELDTSSSGTLADSLDQCVDKKEPEFNTLVRILATRCMLAAEYVAAGSGGSFGHYGLAIGTGKSNQRFYTHFTSPIRRYPDVLAHRMLATAIDYETLHPSLRDRNWVERLVSNCNKRHRNAQLASRASVSFYVGLAIAKRGERLREKAFVIRTFRNGVAVYVSSLGLEGLMTFDEECEFEPEEYRLRVPSRNATLAVFDSCEVLLRVEKDKRTGRGHVVMELA